jgi:hypothetical protein
MQNKIPNRININVKSQNAAYRKSMTIIGQKGKARCRLPQVQHSRQRASLFALISKSNYFFSDHSIILKKIKKRGRTKDIRQFALNGQKAYIQP